MSKLRVLDLFSGIGGFSLGLERTGGFETVAFCEIDPFCRRVLAKHWPKVRQYDDVRTLTAEQLSADGISVDVICGGFPCQDISVAGKGVGIEGARSGLWSEYARIIGEIRPRVVIVENVAALLGGGLERVLGDLAALGFDAEWHCIPASAVGAPHRRDRLWIVAYSEELLGNGGDYYGGRDSKSPFAVSKFGNGRSDEIMADAIGEGRAKFQRRSPVTNGNGNRTVSGHCGADGRVSTHADRQPTQRLAISWGECGQWSIEPDVGRVAHGVPSRVDRLRSLGNAVVPQIPEIIGRAILAEMAA